MQDKVYLEGADVRDGLTGEIDIVLKRFSPFALRPFPRRMSRCGAIQQFYTFSPSANAVD